ncbi:MAG: hypothetical protein H6708_32525, partial [Kofleriaceae bacterium]|nr:hypothetical protein [Kofleriaceae bacterium]
AGAPDVGPADADADADAVAALRGEVEALERDVVARAARERELSRLAYDLSPEVALRALLLALLLGLGVMVVGLVVATRAGALGRATTQVSGGYVVVGAGLLGIVGAIVLGFWRALSANALARRQVVVAIVTAVLILAERAIAWRDGASYAACATQEYVVIGLAATVTAIFAARIWLVVAAIAGACALLLQLWPGRVMIISQAGLALFAVTLALGAWRAGRRRSQQLDALATDHREDRADLP